MTSETRPETSAGTPVQPDEPARHCTGCGEAIEPGWAFCGGCGASLDWGPHLTTREEPATSVLTAPVPVLAGDQRIGSVTAPGDVPVTTTQPAPWQSRRWSRGRIAVTVMLVLVLCALAGAAGYWQDQTQNKLAATRADLARTRHELAARTATLDRTRTRLRETQTTLDGTRADLTDVQRRLRAARLQASGLQGSLSSAQDQLDLQANQIETLKNCLSGVSSSLGYAAQNDYTSAVAALDAVQVSCQRAQAMF